MLFFYRKYIQSTDSDESSEEEKEHKERRVQLKHENSDSEEPSKKSKVLFCQSNFQQLSALEEKRKEKEREKGAKGEEVARVHWRFRLLVKNSSLSNKKQQNCPLLVIFVQETEIHFLVIF